MIKNFLQILILLRVIIVFEVRKIILVTVLTVALNSSATIARTIESVMKQTYNNIEYIIVDGNSQDDTVKIAESYREKFNAIPGRTMKIISEPDLGMYDALNKGARLANGVIVGQVNSDDFYEPDAVKTMAEVYEREKFNVAWGTVRIKTGKGIIIKHAKLPKGGGGMTTTHWHHASTFSERKILLEYPYILEDFCDDFDFILRCYCEGKKLSVTDKVISNFNFGGMSTQKSLSEVIRRWKAICKIYRRYGLSKLYYVQRFIYEFTKYLMA